MLTRKKLANAYCDKLGIGLSFSHRRNTRRGPQKPLGSAETDKPDTPASSDGGEAASPAPRTRTQKLPGNKRDRLEISSLKSPPSRIVASNAGQKDQKFSLKRLSDRALWETNRRHTMKEVKVRFTGDDEASRMIQDAIAKAQGNPILELALKQFIQNAALIGLAARRKASS